MTSDPRALASELSLVLVRITRQLRGRRADAQISLTQLSAIATLARDGAMTPGNLAAREHVQPPSMTRVIASLTDAGLVARTPHPTDGRQVLVSLTDAGRALFEEESNAREEWMTERLASLNEDDRNTIGDAVAILRDLVTPPSGTPTRGR
ncbi:MarR family transcriptional regulator [Rhodococcus rhodnii]|uniref:MarR family transcriptional regulator n=1 Tax=Rhodococcus rhodnii TaxID=38312 RepID=A0A6P2CHI5_9NOCA|nr:MarR family transcriptional regulator [Rhodococcus rhodnii]TXG92257.1 MarR family transcriptional regulator [Rhodococcus rhodnii]